MPTGIKSTSQGSSETYLLFDSEAGGFVSRHGYGQTTTEISDGLVFQSLAAATIVTRILNGGRVMPSGHLGPDEHYQDRPLVKIVDIDGYLVNGKLSAVPEYVDLDTNTGTLT